MRVGFIVSRLGLNGTYLGLELIASATSPRKHTHPRIDVYRGSATLDRMYEAKHLVVCASLRLASRTRRSSAPKIREPIHVTVTCRLWASEAVQC